MAQQEDPPVDWQGLTPAAGSENLATNPERVLRDMGGDVVAEQAGGAYARDEANRAGAADLPELGEKPDASAATNPEELIGDAGRTGKPDARDDAKVERLRAPDWRSDQIKKDPEGGVESRGPLPSREITEEPNEK